MFLNITTSFATKLSLFHINSILVLLLKLCLCFRVISSVRLACLIHVASVHPELGSNSKNKNGAKEICINSLLESFFEKILMLLLRTCLIELDRFLLIYILFTKSAPKLVSIFILNFTIRVNKKPY